MIFTANNMYDYKISPYTNLNVKTVKAYELMQAPTFWVRGRSCLQDCNPPYPQFSYIDKYVLYLKLIFIHQTLQWIQLPLFIFIHTQNITIKILTLKVKEIQPMIAN